MDNQLILIVMGVAFILGLILTVIYYFSRYFIPTQHDEDLAAGRAAAAAEEPPPPSLNAALKDTREGFWGKIQKSLLGQGEINPGELEVLEEILYTSDLGPTTVHRLLDSVEAQLSRQEKKSLDVVKNSLKAEVQKSFA